MARNIKVLPVLLGLVVASGSALAGEDLAFFVAKSEVPAQAVATANGWQQDADLHGVDLTDQRGLGLEASAPATNGGAGGQTAIILWDEVNKGRTQQGNGYSVGSSVQAKSINN